MIFVTDNSRTWLLQTLIVIGSSGMCADYSFARQLSPWSHVKSFEPLVKCAHSTYMPPSTHRHLASIQLIWVQQVRWK